MREQIPSGSNYRLDKNIEHSQWAMEQLSKEDEKLDQVLTAIEQILASVKDIDSQHKKVITDRLKDMKQIVDDGMGELIDYFNDEA